MAPNAGPEGSNGAHRPPPEQLVEALLALAENFADVESFDERMQRICAITQSLLSCDRASIFLRDGSHCYGRYNVGNPPDIAAAFPSFRVKLSDPFIASMIDSRYPVTVNDAGESPLVDHGTARTARIQAIVGAPFFSEQDEYQGFITAEFNENPGRFTPLESRVMMGIGNLVEVCRRTERERLAFREARRSRAELLDRLQRSERLEAIGRLAGGIAHDFNNLLTAVHGNADLLSEEVGPDLEPLVNDIRAATDRAAALTKQLMAFGRGQVMSFRDVDLSVAIPELLPLLRRVIREDISIDYHVPEGTGLVHCDPVQLEQVLMNLVLNARDALDGPGYISVEVEELEIDEEYCQRVPDAKPGPSVRLTVSDDGPGFPPELAQRIFEPFYTGRPGSGSGMGLATVYGIMRQSGGHCLAQSEPGRGARFTVVFPRSTGANLPERAAQPVPAAAGNESILVIDDDGRVRAVMVRVLERFGYEVTSVERAEHALAAMQTRDEPFDLLVSDVVMPDLSGPDLGVLLRRHFPALRVLWVSGYSPDSVDEVPQGPLDAHLAKPFSGDALAASARSLLDRELPDSG